MKESEHSYVRWLTCLIEDKLPNGERAHVIHMPTPGMQVAVDLGGTHLEWVGRAPRIDHYVEDEEVIFTTVQGGVVHAFDSVRGLSEVWISLSQKCDTIKLFMTRSLEDRGVAMPFFSTKQYIAMELYTTAQIIHL